MDLRLYAVTDRSYLHGTDLPRAVELAIQGGATIIQLREKNASSREFYELAVGVLEVTRRHNVPLIINDRVDIALAINADGVHVGQSDLPASVTRRIIGPHRILGVSVATVDEALRAEQDGADYLGVGSVYATMTKQESNAMGAQKVADIKKASAIPVVAIGGITRENARRVMLETGVDGIASVSAVFDGDIERNAQQLLQDINWSTLQGEK
jgi:thiamine-phosphate pyrophosphorylase